MERDFTYITDIVEGILKIITGSLETRKRTNQYYKVYNIGNNKSIKLLEFIEEIEKNLNLKSIKNMMPMQLGDVEKTWANVDSLIEDYDYSPNTSISFGVKQFINWYKKYNKIR